MQKVERAPRRKVRADGQRNRAAILTAARRMLEDKGSGVSLDEIARAAGIGNGTLYRHFPTRVALLDAVCKDDARGLIEAATRFAADHPPVAALLCWLDLLIDHIAERNIVVASVTVLVAPTGDGEAADGRDVRAAMLALFDRAMASGDLRAAFDPLDLLRAIAGLATISPPPDWPDRAKALVRTIIAGRQQPLSAGRGPRNAGRLHGGGVFQTAGPITIGEGQTVR